MDKDTKTYFVMAVNGAHARDLVKQGFGYTKVKSVPMQGVPFHWELYRVEAKRTIEYTATEVK